jgi:hypothetical protein
MSRLMKLSSQSMLEERRWRLRLRAFAFVRGMGGRSAALLSPLIPLSSLVSDVSC